LPASPLIFLATPCYGGRPSALYLRSLLTLQPILAARNVGLHLELGGEATQLERGRAAMMARFLETPATHLLFVDADLGFAADAVTRLLDAGHDVIGGICPSLHPPDDGTDELHETAGAGGDGIRRVSSVAAAFLMISRRAAERLAAAHALDGIPGPRPRETAGVFDSLVAPSGRHLPSDQAFAHRWRAMGGEVWADFASPLRRSGLIEVAHAPQRLRSLSGSDAPSPPSRPRSRPAPR
jgi:hypothetical protein